jgi:hypothetical protein
MRLLMVLLFIAKSDRLRMEGEKIVVLVLLLIVILLSVPENCELLWRDCWSC